MSLDNHSLQNKSLQNNSLQNKPLDPYSRIQFILPSLFSEHCQNHLNDKNKQLMDKLKLALAKANRISDDALTSESWLMKHFDLSQGFKNSAQLMAEGESLGNSLTRKSRQWLRADPVMLSPTHNGILCRGNRVLQLTIDEQRAMETLLNEYLKEHNMQFFMVNSHQGYLHLNELSDVQFTCLDDVVGQDITHRLPQGENSKFWHGLLTDLQMILHNCSVNVQRAEAQQPLINGFWIWGEQPAPQSQKSFASKHLTSSQIFTDSPGFAACIEELKNLHLLPNQAQNFVKANQSESELIIYISEFEQAYLQNDMDAWQSLFATWVEGWLVPAIDAVNNNQLHEVTIITDKTIYQMTPKSRWYFWRSFQ